ncbi:MAG: helix-turn-helix domain-containing protein [Oscillospiraceae bacterium]|nr:helix-turn-helix domain-containing protein [Oscillospiraceae bacterium]
MGLESELMTTADAAALWGITTRRVQILCENGKVNGAFRMGKTWIIPKGTPKPIDGRTKTARQMKMPEQTIENNRAKGL